MPVLFTLLVIVAILAGILLLLIGILFLLPLGFSVEYRPDRFRVVAVYGPFHRTIWSHRLHRREGTGRKREEQKPPVSNEAALTEPGIREKSEKTPEKKPDTKAPQEKETPQNATAGNADDIPPAPASTLPEEEEELESGAVMGRLERMLELAAEDPQALGNCILQHFRWLQRHSLFKVHVRHLNIFWTVTGEDAAKTAVLYGVEMTAFNTALALAQQTFLLHSDRLWLEPDFTGTRRGERHISCTVSACAVLMFHLLYRIWKDPLLQPTGTEAQTI